LCLWGSLFDDRMGPDSGDASSGPLDASWKYAADGDDDCRDCAMSFEEVGEGIGR
jgi:hypothetical protein